MLLERRSRDVSSMLWRVRGRIFFRRTVLLANSPARPRPATPPCAPTRPARGMPRVLDSTSSQERQECFRRADFLHHARECCTADSRGRERVQGKGLFRRQQHPDCSGVALRNLSSPKPGHTKGGSCRGARRSGGADWRGGVGQACSPAKIVRLENNPSSCSPKHRRHVA